jgi:predicted nucleic acid-binding protein
VDPRPALGTSPPQDDARLRRQPRVLPYAKAVAARWGEIQAYAQQRGRPRPANDRWIAACCLVRELPLLTFNTKDFEDFAEHEGLVLFGRE